MSGEEERIEADLREAISAVSDGINAITVHAFRMGAHLNAKHRSRRARIAARELVALSESIEDDTRELLQEYIKVVRRLQEIDEASEDKRKMMRSALQGALQHRYVYERDAERMNVIDTRAGSAKFFFEMHVFEQVVTAFCFWSESVVWSSVEPVLAQQAGVKPYQVGWCRRFLHEKGLLVSPKQGTYHRKHSSEEFKARAWDAWEQSGHDE